MKIIQGTGVVRLPDDLLPSVTLTLDAILREHVASIDGVAYVRMLPRSKRLGRAVNKVYIVLETHDIDRDRRVVEIMCQLEDVDYDLVPVTAAGMIPDVALKL